MWSCNMVVQFMLCCCLLIIVPCSGAQPDYIYHICRNRTTDSFNSLFQVNREVLLSKLASNAAENQGYYNYTASDQNSQSSGSKLQLTNPSTLYGFSLCRGDLSTSECEECVTTATKDIKTRCPNEDLGIIWYGECMARYDTKFLFSSFDQEDEGLAVLLVNSKNVTDEGQFQRVLQSTMNKLKARVSKGIPLNSRTIKSFALGSTNLSSLETLYASAQCVPALTEVDCNRCLNVATNLLQDHNNSEGGRSFVSSCTVRYELYPFYRNIAVEPSPYDLPPPPKTAPTSLRRATGNGGIRLKVIVAIVAPVSVSLLSCLVYCIVFRKAKTRGATPQQEFGDDEISTIESLRFELDNIKAATNNFSPDNNIGVGGFGDVFKGVLADGKEIAVKRLSKSSCQGSREFQNEVVLVAKLQHKNLVRVLGFCLQEDEKILVYEYIPNKSLDNILFDPERQRQLDWATRYKIIVGIARGLVYLHVDSRLRIIHRDLKASNILLDENLNAEVSDFGMARILGGEQTQGNTSRIVGTFGYMSPEYAMHGQFSSKSDVFSFGVLVLEIISGKRNSSFYQSDQGAEDLLSYAWKQWKNGTPLEVMDPSLMESYSRAEVLRCIQIGLLCVQEDMSARSSVAWVLTMLTSHSVSIALPKRPPFFCSSRSETQALDELMSDHPASNSATLSVDDSSITGIYAR